MWRGNLTIQCENVEGVDLCDLFPWLQFNNYSYGTGVWGSILAVVIMVVSGNVTVWRFDV